MRITEQDFNERLEKQKDFEENRSCAVTFYFNYQHFGAPYFLQLYDDCIGLIFYSKDGRQRDETAQFYNKNFNKKLTEIRSKCDDLIQ